MFSAVGFKSLNSSVSRLRFLWSNLSSTFSLIKSDISSLIQKKIANSINKQCLLLISKIGEGGKHENNIFVVKSLILSTLCFDNLRNKYLYSLNLKGFIFLFKTSNSST